MSLQRFIDRVSQNDPGLKRISLIYKEIENIDQLCRALKDNTIVTELDLSGNKISSIDSLVETLKTNITVKVLVLTSNRISAKDIAEILKCNRSIIELKLCCMHIGDNIDIITEALKFNNTLKKLCLNTNNIENVDSLAEALKTNDTLEELYLPYNEIKNIDKLSEMLQYNTSLKLLQLSHNNIKNINKLAEALKHNITLEKLFLISNLFEIDGLVEILKYNTHLIVLEYFERTIIVDIERMDHINKIDEYVRKRIEENQENFSNRTITLFELCFSSLFNHKKLMHN